MKGTLHKIVIGVMAYWVAFVAVMVILFCVFQSIPDTLVQYALGGGAIELLATALIEIFKSKWEKENDKGTDNKETDEQEILDLDSIICNGDSDCL